eukprot:TRINITY_DN29502_c0_g1_i2.p1 TRINITY_DN29502_c0_g1~~TRINITY_DN29502_c0_g1_i2.p1  ORF type:complete len:312 (-),score=18.51 TRINITY_DN29502_c0_g1_i2:508-1443(-)
MLLLLSRMVGLTCSEDRTARVWNVADGAQLAMLVGHLAEVLSAVWAPDDDFVVTASEDGSAMLWKLDVVHEEPERDASVTVLGRQAMLGHDGDVTLAVFSTRGTEVLTCSEDRTAAVWSVPSCERILILSGHQAAVRRAEFSPDDRFVVTASEDACAKVWMVSDGCCIATLRHAGPVKYAAFSPDSELVVTCSQDKAACLWKVDGSKVELFLSLAGHVDTVYNALFSPDGTKLVTSSEDKTAILWDVSDGRRLATLEHDDSVCWAEFSMDSLTVATASWDNEINLWSAVNGSYLHTFNGHAGSVVYVSFGA